MLPSTHQGRLLTGGAGREVRDSGKPDIASFVAFADAFQGEEMGIRRGVFLQDPRQLVITMVGIPLHNEVVAA